MDASESSEDEESWDSELKSPPEPPSPRELSAPLTAEFRHQLENSIATIMQKRNEFEEELMGELKHDRVTRKQNEARRKLLKRRKKLEHMERGCFDNYTETLKDLEELYR